MPDLRVALLALALASPALAQEVPESDVFTLFRDSIVPQIDKVHVATFDTKEGRDYNRENCLLAMKLFQEQRHIKTVFWCEPGRYIEAK